MEIPTIKTTEKREATPINRVVLEEGLVKTTCDSCEAIYPQKMEEHDCECGGTIRNLYEHENGSADWTPLDFPQGDESFAETLQELMAEIQEEE